MINMSYVKFENTYKALAECYDSFDDSCSDLENDYRNELIKLCEKIYKENKD